MQQNLKTVMRYVLNGRGERVRKELDGKQAPGRDFIYDAKQGSESNFVDAAKCGLVPSVRRLQACLEAREVQP